MAPNTFESIAARLAEGGGADLSSVELNVLVRTLRATVTKDYPTLRDQADDVASTALVQYLGAARLGKVQADDHPSGYLITCVRNEAKQLLRRQTLAATRPVEGLEAAAGGDEVAGVLERLDAAELVRAGLREALQAGDGSATATLHTALDLAGPDAGKMTVTEIAAYAGLSRPTVRAVFDYFAEWAEQPGRWERLSR